MSVYLIVSLSFILIVSSVNTIVLSLSSNFNFPKSNETSPPFCVFLDNEFMFFFEFNFFFFELNLCFDFFCIFFDFLRPIIIIINIIKSET